MLARKKLGERNISSTGMIINNYFRVLHLIEHLVVYEILILCCLCSNILDVRDVGDSVQVQTTEFGNFLDIIPHRCYVLPRNADPLSSPDMPVRFQRQILDHDASKYHHLSVDIVHATSLGQVKTVGDVLGNPREVLVRVEKLEGVV